MHLARCTEPGEGSWGLWLAVGGSSCVFEDPGPSPLSQDVTLGGKEGEGTSPPPVEIPRLTAFNVRGPTDARGDRGGPAGPQGLTLLPDEVLAVHGLQEDEVAEDGALQHDALAWCTAGDTEARSDTATERCRQVATPREAGSDSYLHFRIFSKGHARASKWGTSANLQRFLVGTE